MSNDYPADTLRDLLDGAMLAGYNGRRCGKR